MSVRQSDWIGRWPGHRFCCDVPGRHSFGILKEGANYGWPICYYDDAQKKLVLAPEYGGDGGKKIGECDKFDPPVAAFPAR